MSKIGDAASYVGNKVSDAASYVGNKVDAFGGKVNGLHWSIKSGIVGTALAAVAFGTHRYLGGSLGLSKIATNAVRFTPISLVTVGATPALVKKAQEKFVDISNKKHDEKEEKGPQEIQARLDALVRKQQMKTNAETAFKSFCKQRSTAYNEYLRQQRNLSVADETDAYANKSDQEKADEIKAAQKNQEIQNRGFFWRVYGKATGK